MDGIQMLGCSVEKDVLVVRQLVDVVGGVDACRRRLDAEQTAVEIYVFAKQEGGWRAANTAVEA
jgi:hypothetical protein